MAKSLAQRLNALEKMVARFMKPERLMTKKKAKKKKLAAKKTKKKAAPKRKAARRRKRPLPMMIPPTIPLL